LKILVIGEAIIDEYVYGFPIGKAGKESIIALKYLKAEKFAGGTLATANHIANFCNSVDLFTLLGDNNSQEEFIESHLNKKINKLFHYKKDSPTIVKRRFLTENPHTGYLTKLLEYYIINDNEVDKEQSLEMQAHLKKILPNYDLVLVIDYGHGMFSREIIDLITKKSRFLAVNTQTNAGNMGFNTISKYSNADYICIDEPEIRFDTRERFAHVEDLIIGVTKKLSCGKMILTRGTEGCIVYSYDDFVSIPAFSERVIDTMGAGDAFISITSPLVANKTPMNIVGFVGNAVGALKCMYVGNKEPIEKATLYKYITSLMK
jgi:bifunctional ADP-heptose synthase (sugar kinase/adenylyltransferase)